MLMDEFEGVADRLFKQLNLESTIPRIQIQEQNMFTRASKFVLSPFLHNFRY